MKSPPQKYRYNYLWTSLSLLVLLVQLFKLDNAKAKLHDLTYEFERQSQIVEKAVADVQHVTSPGWKGIDPKKPVLVTGTLRRVNKPDLMDDESAGVSFGDGIAAIRTIKQSPFLTKKSPKSAQPEQQTKVTLILSQGDFILNGAVFSPEVRDESGVIVEEAWRSGEFGTIDGYQKLSFHPEKCKAAKASRAKPKWDRLEKSSTGDSGRLNYHLRGEQSADISVVYDWIPPMKVNFLGGYRDGSLIPYEWPNSQGSQFFLSREEIELKSVLKDLVKEPLRFSSARSKRKRTKGEKIRQLGMAVLLLSSLVCFILFLKPQD